MDIWGMCSGRSERRGLLGFRVAHLVTWCEISTAFPKSGVKSEPDFLQAAKTKQNFFEGVGGG